MAKLVKLVVTLGILGGLAYAGVWYVQNLDSDKDQDPGKEAVRQEKGDKGPYRNEERLGFTTETVGP